MENQRDSLLAFAGILDERLAQVAQDFKVPVYLVRARCELEGLDHNHDAYWQREAWLHKKLGQRFHDVQTAVREVMADTPPTAEAFVRSESAN